MVKFGDVVHNIAQRIDPADAQTDVYVGLEHLEPDTLHLRQWGHPSDVTGQKLVFKKGDVIFGRRRAYQRKLALAECDGICSAHAMVIRAKQDMILPEFLPFFLQSDMFMERAVQISVGSLSPTINWKTLKEQMFPLPPLEEQKRLAELLWAADDAVEKLTHSVSLLDKIAENYLSHFLSNAANNVISLPTTDICEKISVGIVIKPASYYVQSGGYPALRSLNVLPEKIILDDLVYISEYGCSKNKKAIVKEGDVVIVRTGRPGDACTIAKEHEGFIAIDLIIVRPTNKILSKFLSLFINSTFAKKQLRKHVAGTAQTHFNVGELKKIKIPMISNDMQLCVIEYMEKITLKKSILDKNIYNILKIKKFFLRYLTGAKHV